jgi:hypothetical protein
VAGCEVFNVRIASRERAIRRIGECSEFVPMQALNLFDRCRAGLLHLLGFDAGNANTGTSAL